MIFPGLQTLIGAPTLDASVAVIINIIYTSTGPHSCFEAFPPIIPLIIFHAHVKVRLRQFYVSLFMFEYFA